MLQEAGAECGWLFPHQRALYALKAGVPGGVEQEGAFLLQCFQP